MITPKQKKDTLVSLRKEVDYLRNWQTKHLGEVERLTAERDELRSERDEAQTDLSRVILALPTGESMRSLLAVEGVRKLRAERDLFLICGIAEIAARNPNVMDYMKHWEGRATKAEDALKSRIKEHGEMRAALIAAVGRLAVIAETSDRFTDDERLMPAAGVADVLYDVLDALEGKHGEPAPITPQPDAPVTLTYTNWRGETAERTIVPRRVWFGSTEWHPEPQWLLTALDVEKNAERDFALRDFGIAAPAAATTEATDAMPQQVMAWLSLPKLHHIGTWATTRYPDDAVSYIRADAITPQQAAQVPEVAALIEAAKAIQPEWARHLDDGLTYRVVNAGNKVWADFCSALRALGGQK